jgi:hypothetical protein
MIKETTNDLITGAIHEVVFGCANEQEQTRGGLPNYGEHVVNTKKVDDMLDKFEEQVAKYFERREGLVVHTSCVYGGDYGFKGYYIHFRLEVRQTMRSMWDYSAESIIQEFVDRIDSVGDFTYLTTISKDRTETILDALEHGSRE